MTNKALLLLLAATACGPLGRPARTLSLTGEGFTGKKYYLGVAEYLDGFMGNETRYDVKHTHDIFASGAGGDYEATRLVDREVRAADVHAAWSAIGAKIKGDDMFVQYSSGHGYEGGLGIGVTYDEIRDNALSYGARETVVFTMACHSGALADSFREKQSDWGGFAAQGRSLFVMASSRADQLSSTGPGRDADEPGGPNGSAGSAFGHALWKGLSGEADGFVDGVRDGYVALGEIDAFVRHKTREIGGHDPVVAGVFQPGLIMNRVPSPAAMAAIMAAEE